MILNYSHIAIGVTDMDAALRFYRDVLGLTVSADWVKNMKSSSTITSGRQVQRRCVWLRWAQAGGDTPAVTLDQMIDPAPVDRRAKLFDLGINHIGFWVDDLDAIKARAEALGFEVFWPMVAKAADYGEPGGDTIQTTFLHDADGNLIQCDKRVPGGK